MWTEIVRKWSGSGLKWSEIVPWSKIAQDGVGWTKMVQYGPRWFEMVQQGLK